MNEDVYIVKITSQVLLAGILLFLAYLGGRVTRRLGLGEISGQILGGFIGGPVLMKLATNAADTYPHVEALMMWSFPLREAHQLGLASFTFFLPLYMGVILFSITDETHIDRVKENWKNSLTNFVLQSVGSFLLVSLSLYFFCDVDFVISAIAGCLAAGTSPCATFISMTRRQVEGRFRTVWSQSVLLEAIAEILIVFLVANYLMEGTDWDAKFLGKSLIIIVAISLLGFWCIRTAVSNSFSSDDIKGVVNDSKLKSLLSSDTIPTVNILFVVWAVVAILVGISMGLRVPFMLPVILAGLITANVHNQYVFDSLRIQDLMSFFHLIFFMLIGAHIDLDILFSIDALKISGIYFVTRAVGKLGGSYLSCCIMKEKKEKRKYFPLLFMPNLGATGVAFLAMHQGGTHEFNFFFRSLMPAFILSELVGGPLINWAVKRWKQIQLDEKSNQVDHTKASAQKEVDKISMENLLNDRVLLNVELRSREDAIKMLCSELMKQGNITELQATISLVLEREKLCSTGIGDEIAIPHCRSADVDYPMAVCAYVQDGESLEWDSLDGVGVRYIFLLVSPLNEPALHIEAMKTLTKHIGKKNFLIDLKKAAKQKRIVTWLRSL